MAGVATGDHGIVAGHTSRSARDAEYTGAGRSGRDGVDGRKRRRCRRPPTHPADPRFVRERRSRFTPSERSTRRRQYTAAARRMSFSSPRRGSTRPFRSVLIGSSPRTLVRETLAGSAELWDGRGRQRHGLAPCGHIARRHHRRRARRVRGARAACGVPRSCCRGLPPLAGARLDRSTTVQQQDQTLAPVSWRLRAARVAPSRPCYGLRRL